MEKIRNIDSEINKCSYKMVEKLIEKNASLGEIDKALGVLSNDGVYGYYVYCKSKSKDVESITFKVFVADIIKNFGEFADEESDKSQNEFKAYDKYFSDLSQDIHKLLFFKEILEKVLTYARYHAKAYGDDNE